jgi:hypothetical protein
MITPTEVRRMVADLPELEDRSDDRRLALEVGGKGFAWSFNERIHPKKPRVPRLDILAVRCPMDRKALLVEAAPDRFFDDDHYRGFPAVLVRLDVVDADELEGLLRDAWRIQAPKALLKRLGL